MNIGLPSGKEWAKQNVLVGVLHNTSQLSINREHKFYHMPVALLLCPAEEIKYIAIYQSIRLFGGLSGIRYFGKVKNFRLLPRGEITEIPTENYAEVYCRFTVTAWETLAQPIRAVGIGPDVSILTNEFLLFNSRYTAELYIASPRDYQVYRTIRSAVISSRKSGHGQKLATISSKYAVTVSDWTVGIYSTDGQFEELNFKKFYREPYPFLGHIGQYLRL